MDGGVGNQTIKINERIRFPAGLRVAAALFRQEVSGFWLGILKHQISGRRARTGIEPLPLFNS